MTDEAFLASLPTQGTERFDGHLLSKVHWTPRRKASLVFAVQAGMIDFEQARTRFGLSEEELQSWIAAIKTNGIPGLRVTRYQIYRDNPLPHSRRYTTSATTSFGALLGRASPQMRERAGR